MLRHKLPDTQSLALDRDGGQVDRRRLGEEEERVAVVGRALLWVRGDVGEEGGGGDGGLGRGEGDVGAVSGGGG